MFTSVLAMLGSSGVSIHQGNDAIRELYDWPFLE
jgi:hypothetical protein